MCPKSQGAVKTRSRLIVISAPSGAGKTTLCEMLLKEFPSIVRSVSTTTRPRRPHEKEGIHYHFVDKSEFQRLVDAGEFAEWAEVHAHSYGTPKANIDKLLKQGKSVIFNIDVQGAMSLLKLFKERVLLIFIRPPSIEELQKRLVNRKEDSLATIEKRLKNAYNELEWSKSFDYQITNDSLNLAYRELREIVKKECL